MLSIFLEYSVDSAHFLPNVPPDHKCGTMHGHRYEIVVEISGEPNFIGWIIDYDDAKRFLDPIIGKLDHVVLNDIEGLENPTCEHIALWLRDQILPAHSGVSLIKVRETARAGVVWRA